LAYTISTNLQVFTNDVEEVKLFLNSINSYETQKYSTHVKYIESQGHNDPFWHNNTRLIEHELINFIIEMKNKKINYSAILNYTAAA